MFIELLRVILILGIISLIAISTVNKVVEQVKKGSVEQSENSFIENVENKILENEIAGEEMDV